MVYDRVAAYYDVLCDEKRKERRIVSRSTAAGLPRKKGVRLGGDNKVERLRHLLEHGFSDDRGKLIVRSREQRNLHEIYIRTCLAKLYQVTMSVDCRWSLTLACRTNGRITASAS